MFVIGTAGHVDHGKSTLVERLTGIDPDRLREEKERGMTIDLGFAWLTLPGGDEVSIVDVPGHERFVNNMLAGVGGIDLALLIVAADESVMPQTREHTAILDLLQVERGLAVVTKSDLVDDEWLELVQAEVEDLLEGTSLEGSPILAVSATTGEGVAELTAAIEARLGETEPRRDLGRPRMAVDRSFTMSGFGTVVTGTLIDGSLAVGQSVEIVPTGRTSRVRGLQSHKRKLDSIGPGNRVAANVAGISQGDVQRGEVLTVPGWLAPSEAMDVRLQVIPGASRAVRHNMFATIHVGSSETVGRVRLLDCDRAEPGDLAWAQIKFEQPQAVVKGDCFVVRSNHETLGGGRVVDPHAKRHRRNYAPLLERLAVMEAGSDRDVLIKGIEASEPVDLRELARRANMEPGAVVSEIKQMASERLVVPLGDNPSTGSGQGVVQGTVVYTSAGWAGVSSKARSFLEEFHGRFPLRRGASKEELRSRLGMKAAVFGAALALLEADGVLVEDGPAVRRPDYVRVVSDSQQREIDAYMVLLASNRYSPPTDSPPDPELLSLLVEDGRVTKVSDSVVFESAAYEEMVEAIRAKIQESGEVTVADVRDMFGGSRKYSLALMDYLDQQRITRRVGDARVLR